MVHALVVALCSLSLSLLLLSPGASSATVDFSKGRCKSLSASPEARLTNPCVGVVDYQYFLPDTTTDAALARTVSARLNSTAIASSPMDCQTRLVRLVCAQVYLKCAPGVALANNATYNYDIYAGTGVTFGVPYQRPCVSLCTELTAYCTGAGRLLTFIPAPQCAAQRTDYSQGAVALPPKNQSFMFENNNNASRCFFPALKTLSGAKEQYRSTAAQPVCAPFVEDFFVPPGNKIDPSYTSLLPPTIAQTVLDKRIATLLAQLKPWTSEECMFALRRRFCYGAFLRYEDVTVRAALEASGTPAGAILQLSANPAFGPATLDAALTVPAYPAYEYCTEYTDKCSALIAQVSALRVDCNGTATGADGTTYRVFPQAKRQLITTFSRALSASTTLNLHFYSNTTTDGRFNASKYSYTTQCPTGFSVPAEPDREEIQWVPSSGCAVNCLMPVWTPTEWDDIAQVSEQSPVLGVLASLLLLVFLAVTKELLNSHLLTVYSLLALAVSVQSCRLTASSSSLHERFCYDDTVYLSQPQGDSECVQQAATITYTFPAAVACLGMLAVQWALRSNPSTRTVPDKAWFFVLQYALVLGLPVVTTVIAAEKELFGFSKSQGWCFVRSAPYAQENLDIALVGLPVLAWTALMYVTVFVNAVLIFVQRRRGVRIAVVADSESVPPENSKEDNHHVTMTATSAVAANANHEATSPSSPSLYSQWLSPADGTGDTAVAAWPIVCLLAFSFLFPFLARFGLQYGLRDSYQSAIVDWITCVFGAYDGTDDSWKESCGAYPKDRPQLGMVRMNTVLLTSHAIFIFPAFAMSYLFIYYWRGTHKRSAGDAQPTMQTRVVVVGNADAHVVGDAQL